MLAVYYDVATVFNDLEKCLLIYKGIADAD